MIKIFKPLIGFLKLTPSLGIQDGLLNFVHLKFVTIFDIFPCCEQFTMKSVKDLNLEFHG